MSTKLFPHNLKTYKELVTKLNESQSVAIIQATGTGKSYIAYNYIKENKSIKNILILVPSIVLASEWEKLTKSLSKEITIKTYQYLLTLEDKELEELVSDNQFVILDELHRCGASIWGIQIKKIFGYTKHSKILGLTATPIRTLDNYRDMSKELFNDNIIYGVDIATGISLKILPTFKYVAALFQGEDQINESKKKVENSSISKESKDDLTEKLDKLLLDYRTIYNIKSIINKHINNHKHFVLFCNSIKESEELDLNLNIWFNKPKILSVNHKDSKSKVQKTLKEFENSKDNVTILKSIDMLNEGLHLKNVDGLIMLRKTESEIIFLQQLGRALTANSVGKDIIVFDFVGNHCNLRGRQKIASIISDFNMQIKDPNLQIITDDMCIETLELLEKINNAIASIWSEEEDAILLKYYPLEGGKCSSRLSNRTEIACKQRALRLGLSYERSDIWKEKEDAILTKYYPLEGTKCFSKLPHRTKNACKTRVGKLGLSYKKIAKWSEEEDAILLKYYPLEKQKSFLRLPHMTKSLCKSRINILGLYEKSDNEWTKKEDSVLRKYYPKEGTDCFSRLSKRTKEACRKRVSRLGLTKKHIEWTEEDDDILTNYYPVEGVNVYKRFKNRSKSACLRRVKVLDIKSYKDKANWSEKEIEELRLKYPGINDGVIKKLMGDESI